MDQKAGITAESSVRAIPPRFWWLRRILIVGGALFLVLVCVRWWWGWEAHRRLQAEIDKYIAAGEPIYPADFDSPEIPADQNAARLLLEAEAALNLTPEQTALLRELHYGSDEVRKHLDEVRTIVMSNAEALVLVRRARGLPGVDWGTKIRSPATNWVMPNFSAHRELARLLGVSATYHHATGNDAEAIETLLDWHAQTSALFARPFLLSNLVARATRALMDYSIEYLAPRMTLHDDSGSAGDGAIPANREQFQALTAELLDEEDFRGADVRALMYERMSTLDFVQTLLRGDTRLTALTTTGGASPVSTWGRIQGYPLLPLIELDSLWTLRYYTQLAEAVAMPTWPEAASAMPPDPKFGAGLEKIVHPVSRAYVAVWHDRWVLLHYRCLAQARMAGISLAIRLYQIDHGQRPESLVDLVPGYLTEVPADPFADDGRAIGYKPDAPLPILYSINSDGVDDGGAYEFSDNGGIKREKLDFPFFLDGDRPRRKTDVGDTSTERSDDHQKAEDKPADPTED